MKIPLICLCPYDAGGTLLGRYSWSFLVSYIN